ncbi:hypothetical protein C6Y03_14015 [Bacillus sp. LNXM65]|nr:hypothetical protein C6Y03_14015 [Bacillus sp. LNXM65]
MVSNSAGGEQSFGFRKTKETLVAQGSNHLPLPSQGRGLEFCNYQRYPLFTSIVTTEAFYPLVFLRFLRTKNVTFLFLILVI